MSQEAQIIDVKQVALGTVELVLGLSKEFDFQAGQYIRVIVPRLISEDPRGNSRDFSIASSPRNENKLSIAFRISESPFKQSILRSQPGTKVTVEGPFGNFILPADTQKSVVFLAGGIGITPFLSMIRFVTEKKLPHKIKLLYLNKNPESGAYLSELKKLEKQNPNFVLNEKFGLLDREFIEKSVNTTGNIWYIAGPPSMAKEARIILDQLGITNDDILIEEFTGYPFPSTDGKELPAITPEHSIADIEAIFQALNKSVLVSETDTNGTIIYANDKFVETSKYSLEELIGQNHRILKSGFHKASFYEDLWKTISEGKVWRGEIKNKAKDGTFYWVDANIAPVLDKNGKSVKYIAIRFLITERKMMEEKLKTQMEDTEKTKLAILNLLEDIEEEKEGVERKVVLRTRELEVERSRLLASINSLSFGFIIADLNHRILLKNNAMLELFGAESKEIISIENISSLFGKEFDIKGEAERCVKGGKVCEIKEIVFGKKFLRGIIAPIVMAHDHGEIIGYVFLLEDITEAKVMERSREEFFAVASHELRTPLTAIRGNAEMILDMYADKVTDKDMKEMLVDIDTSSVRLIEIVNDFLEVSRLEQGRIQIKKEVFNISEVIERVIRNLEGSAKKRGLPLLYVVPKAPLTNVIADKNRVEQIMVNLISNAIKFTEKGSVSINVESIPNFLKIQVIDTGIGISPHNQTLLFRKFQQAGEKILARDITQGTGLGLYISQLLVSSMGGTIALEKSTFGEGSTFTFTIPIAT